MRKSLDIDIAWGGYYGSITDSGEISVFRLLDFNRVAYHTALFTEEFTSFPTVEELVMLSPFIGHAPIDARALLNEAEIRLIGSKPLTLDDLEGYMYYLNDHGDPQEEIDEFAGKIIGLSHEQPLRIHLEIVNDELVISKHG